MTRFREVDNSFQSSLQRYVTVFLLLPAVLVSIFVLYMNYRGTLEQAQLKVDAAGVNYAQQLVNELVEVRTRLYDFREDDALGEVADNVLFTQFASGRLQRLVDSIEPVSAAFIRDGAGYNVVGFPFEVLGVESPLISEYTRRAIEENSVGDSTRLFLVEDASYRRPGGEMQADASPGQLLFAIPVHVATRSFTEPREVRSMLWLDVDLHMMIREILDDEWLQGANAVLRVGDTTLLRTATDRIIDAQIHTTAAVELPVIAADGPLEMALTLGVPESTLTGAAWLNFVEASIGLIAAAFGLHFLLRKFSARLNAPLEALITYSRSISDEQYDDIPTRLHFKEFEELGQAMHRMSDRVRDAMRELRESATTDALTGLMNRGAFDDTAEREFHRHHRGTQADKALWLIIFDIDHFKRVNDTAGHAMGDRIIQAVADVAKAAGRSSDIAARLGGEEYGLLLPEGQRDAVLELAEEIRRQVAALFIEGWTKSNGAITVSLGCASAVGKRSFDELYRAADDALYASKWNGRDRVSVEPDPIDSARDLSPSDTARMRIYGNRHRS